MLLKNFSSRHGLDLNSPLQILIEIYIRWLKTNPNNVCLQLRYELFRSFIYLSDFFTSAQQLIILNELCQEYLTTWIDEDDLMISLISYGLCKTGILLGQTKKDTNELYIRLVERNLKYFSKNAAYASALFLLESHEEDLTKSLQTVFNQEWTNEVIGNLALKTNLDIRLNGWILSTFFYLLENSSADLNAYWTREDLLDNNDLLTKHLMNIGTERLFLLNRHSKSDLSRLCQRPKAILRQAMWPNVDHLILIFVSLYTSFQNSVEQQTISTNDSMSQDQENLENSLRLSPLDNEMIELVGEFYERIKQSVTLPHEAVLLLRPLPLLFAHHGLPDRLMNKIVAEFAASIHLYPQILAYTVFAVFRALIDAQNSAKVNEWTLLSLKSVAQRKPCRMAVWALTCLLLSACESTTIANAL